MASGTKIRPLIRLLDAADAPLWAIDSSGRILYLSAACGDWLGVEIELLLERRAIAGVPLSDDPLDHLAACLSPPPGMQRRGTATLRIEPPSLAAATSSLAAKSPPRATPLEVRFVRVGQGESSVILGVGGAFDDRVSEPELHDAVALRQRLDAWRRRDANLATIATAGTSPAARRARRRLQVAASIRCDVGFFGPPGCGSEAVAARIHQLSAPGEPLVRVDGPLMDAELLDAVLMPVVHQLGESSDSRATALVRGLDEMPLEAQQRLLALLRMTPGRLRLLALSRLQPAVLAEPVATPGEEDGLAEYSGGAAGIATELIEILSAMTVTTQPLCSRVEDIPLLATALLDARRAAGQGTVERLSRAALDALVIYPWPRNLDELEEAIGHAMRTAPGPLISAEHLPLAIRSFRPGESPANSRRAIVPLDAAVERYEARLIREAIEASGGNRAEAARKLGISRARLLRKMEVELDNDSQATKRSAP